MSQKYKIRFSMGMKSAINIIIIAIIIGGAAAIFSYRAYCSNLDAQTTGTANNVCVAAAAQVEAESIDSYLESLQTDEQYDSIRDKLCQIQQYYGIVEICCFKPVEGGFLVVYDTGDMQLGEKLTFTFSASLNVEQQLLAGEDIEPFQQETRQGTAVYALTPIRDNDGTTHGYMAVIYSMTDTLAAEKAFLSSLNRILFIITAVLAIGSVFTARYLLVRPLNRLSNIADGFVTSQRAGTLDPENMAADVPQLDTGDEMGRLYHAVGQMEQSIYDYIADLTKITAEKERIGAELSVATKIQASMLPCIFPPFPNRTEFDIYATMAPAKEVGGDFYDFFLVDDDHLALVIADVSGKGIPAALFMVITKVLLKNAAQTGMSPKAVLETVNTQLCANNPIDMFVTVWLGILEISTGKLTCANAGHEYPALCKAGGNFSLIKDSHGLVLACFDDSEYTEYELQLDPGDTLYVYTDGVAEATDGDNNLFGTDRMLQSLNCDATAEPKELLRRMRGDIEAFVGDAPQFDDITMLGIKYFGADNKSDEREDG